MHMELLKSVLPWAEIILSILLIGLILLQRSGAEVGGALGSGGDGSSGTTYTRRGIEKGMFYMTIVVAILFMVVAFTSLLLATPV
jgi:preprotein translocase subunit SecG